jgi:endonuclease/exonuclease/phosphatase family metal-dependent hydrolase
LNIWIGKLIQQIVSLVESEQPDILCLQEVYSSGDKPVRTPDIMFNSLEIIKMASRHKHWFFAPTFLVVCDGISFNFGNAIISKYLIEDQQTLFINGKSIIPGNHNSYWQKDPPGNQTTIG